MNKFFYLGLTIIVSLSACSDDDVDTSDDAPVVPVTSVGLEVPTSYEFANEEGESTVSFSGQTQRLQMGEEILDLFENFETTEETLDQMFADGTGFLDVALNESGKQIRSKVAASDDYFATNTSGASEIKSVFDGYIASQVADFNSVYESKDAVVEASAGVAGIVTESDLETTRLINADGFEYKQIFNKGLIGALTLDQIVNNYLTRCLDAENQDNNTNDVLVEGKSYTSLEHFWDEAYGYAFGNTGDDSFLFKYITRAEEDADFAGIQQDILDAFLTGRAAIVANDYDVVADQVEFLQETLSKVIGIRAVYYLENGIINLQNVQTFGDACHDLSEGYGFIYSLQFTRNPITDASYVSAETVASYIDILEEENGLWDHRDNTTSLENMSVAIAEEFDFTVAQASSTDAVTE